SDYYNPNTHTNLHFRHTTDTENEELTAYVSYSNNHGNNNSYYYTLYEKPGSNGEDNPNQQSNTGRSHNQFLNAQADYTTPMGEKGKLEAGFRATARKNENDYNALLYNWDTQEYEKSEQLSNTYEYKENVYAGYTNLAGALGNLGYQVGARVEQASLKGYSYSRDTSVDN